MTRLSLKKNVFEQGVEYLSRTETIPSLFDESETSLKLEPEGVHVLMDQGTRRKKDNTEY